MLTLEMWWCDEEDLGFEADVEGREYECDCEGECELECELECECEYDEPCRLCFDAGFS